MTADRGCDDLHHLIDGLTPCQAERLRVLVADLVPAAEPEGEQADSRRVSIIAIWDSGRGDLSERHDEINRERLKRSA